MAPAAEGGSSRSSTLSRRLQARAGFGKLVLILIDYQENLHSGLVDIIILLSKRPMVISLTCLSDLSGWQVDEWWEQPAATVVEWVTVDGQNAGTWLALVKQLQTTFYEKQLL